MKKQKPQDPSVVYDSSLVDSSIKDVPITLPCGTTVKLGMTIYSVQNGTISSYGYESIKPLSGKVSTSVIESKVISLNTKSNARCFTVKSDRGCETTYSVRNNCLPKLYGKKSAAIEEQKEINAYDIAKIQTKLTNTELLVKKQKAAIASLKKFKF